MTIDSVNRPTITALAPTILGWDSALARSVCPGCPEHAVAPGTGRYEVALSGPCFAERAPGHDVLHAIRRAPDFASDDLDIPALPSNMRAVAIIDYLERQTFSGTVATDLAKRLGPRLRDVTVHVWPIDPHLGGRIAEDARWEPGLGYLVRSPSADIAPHEYPMDVGWREAPDLVDGPDGTIERWRGCLYVDTMAEELVRHGWDGIHWAIGSADAPDD